MTFPCCVREGSGRLASPTGFSLDSGTFSSTSQLLRNSITIWKLKNGESSSCCLEHFTHYGGFTAAAGVVVCSGTVPPLRLPAHHTLSIIGVHGGRHVTPAGNATPRRPSGTLHPGRKISKNVYNIIAFRCFIPRLLICSSCNLFIALRCWNVLLASIMPPSKPQADNGNSSNDKDPQ